MFDGPGVVFFLGAGLVLGGLFVANYVLDLQLKILEERKKRLRLERQLRSARTRIPRPIEAERQ